MSYIKPHGPRNGNMTWEDFDQFSSVYEFFGPFLFLSKTKMFLISSTLDLVIEKFSLKYLEMIVSMFRIKRPIIKHLL